MFSSLSVTFFLKEGFWIIYKKLFSLLKDIENEPLYEISVQEEITARLHFIKFENTYIETCLDFIKDHLVNTETKVIKATGGGAYKFKDLIEKKLGLK